MKKAVPLSTHRFALDTDAPVGLCGVYMIEHVETGRVYVGHVGGTSGRGFAKRCREHFYNATKAKAQHKRSRLGGFVRKHGSEGFLFHVMCVIGAACANEVFIMAEQALMDEMKASGPNGFNLHPHATTPRGVVRSVETKLEMSASRKKMLFDNPAALDSLRARLVTRNKSLDAKARASRMNADPVFQSKRKEALRAALAVPGANERKIEAMKSAWCNPDRRESASLRGVAMMADPARRARISNPVVCLSSGIVYPSRNAAALAFGKSPQALSAHLNGRAASFSGNKFAYVGVIK